MTRRISSDGSMRRSVLERVTACNVYRAVVLDRSQVRTDDGGVAEMTDIRERLRRFLIRAMSRTHGGVYRASGGRLLGRVAGMPVLLLTTTGRESGRPRTATLTYFRDGGDLVVIGSFGGSDLPPAWWLNLQRDPRGSVLIGGTTSRVTARAATGDEHDRLWPLVTETYPGYARYQTRTARPIPIVLLTPDSMNRSVSSRRTNTSAASLSG
jgi:deazaflavin-dependent oxidoreductase (nitroreductase family)